MNALMLALLALAALSLGLRTTSVLLAARLHPLIRLAAALITGAVMTLAFLELCRSYQVFEMGLGLLASLAPVGLFDLAKWWFLRNSRNSH